MAETIRILLVDDHPVLRSGLEALLDLEEGMQVVGRASTGEEGVEKARLLSHRSELVRLAPQTGLLKPV